MASPKNKVSGCSTNELFCLILCSLNSMCHAHAYQKSFNCYSITLPVQPSNNEDSFIFIQKTESNKSENRLAKCHFVACSYDDISKYRHTHMLLLFPVLLCLCPYLCVCQCHCFQLWSRQQTYFSVMSIENDINQLNQPPHLSASFTFLHRSRIVGAAVAVGRVPWAREQPNERINERMSEWSL